MFSIPPTTALQMTTKTTTQTHQSQPQPHPESSILTNLQEKGYIHIPQLIPPGSSLFQRLLSVTQEVTQRARKGSWPYVRTLPKQFPPWSAESAQTDGIWGVQHLLHPHMSGREEFAQCYFSDELVSIAKRILNVERDEELVMELWNLLVRPGTESEGKDFTLRWHRDDIGPDVVGEEEERALGLSGQERRTYSHTQFNLSLASEEDCSLIVVPGSHARARTAEETRLMQADPWCSDMPGQLVVTLRPGDVVFYDNNILHRGVYAGDKERWTLHGSYSRSGVAKQRARNVLQHGIGSWIQECKFDGMDEKLKTRAEVMKTGLLRMGHDEGWTGEYSLQG